LLVSYFRCLFLVFCVVRTQILSERSDSRVGSQVAHYFIKTENDSQMPYEIKADAHKNTFAHPTWLKNIFCTIFNKLQSNCHF